MDSPVGRISVVTGPGGLSGVSWCEQTEPVGQQATDEPTERALCQLREYFGGDRREFALGVDWGRLTPTSRRVLRTLSETVGYGESVTYGALARRSGTGIGARGVGSVMAANPMPVIVPCHRVLARDGLGGYSGGRGRDGPAVKRWLLIMEGALPPTLDWDPARMTV